jgi:hypothetical protein
MFASHSFEGYYQSIRRCWRFGQTRPVVADIVSAESEQYVRENMTRKASAAALMFDALVAHMNEATRLERAPRQRSDVAVPLPQWFK